MCFTKYYGSTINPQNIIFKNCRMHQHMYIACYPIFIFLTFGFTYSIPAVAIKKQENKKELRFVFKNEE